MRFRWLLAAALLLAACDRAERSAEAPPSATKARGEAAAPPPVMLVDSTLPPAVAGEQGWDYHHRATADLDGDGAPEQAALIARVSVDEDRPLWDDGQPWQLYIQESDGTRTYAYSRFVQLGTVEAHVSTAPAGGGALRILLVEQTPHSIRIFEITYAGPGRVTAVERLAREIHPERGFAPAHFRTPR